MTKPLRGNRARSGAAPAQRWLAAVASASATLLVITAVLVVAGLGAYFAPGPAAPNGATATTVLLRKGAGLAEIAGELKRAGVIGNAPVFMALAEVSGSARKIKSGEYLTPSRASISTILKKLRNGDIVHHHLTVPEGASAKQVKDLLDHMDVLTGDTPDIEEGSVLPETYDVLRGETRTEVLKRMTDSMDRLLSQLWAKRQDGLPVHSPEEAVILASIVEKETAKESDRPRVAAVYINRLRIGMKLDADPTVIYGVTGGLPLGRGIRASELAADTPYNTYLHKGLPPTPICVVSLDALKATMNPPAGNWLFFTLVSKDGTMAFSDTYDQQLANQRLAASRGL